MKQIIPNGCFNRDTLSKYGINPDSVVSTRPGTHKSNDSATDLLKLIKQ